jgi:hypothetical protein
MFAQEVNKFVFEISQEESGEKSKKLAALRLEEEEWDHVELFVHILKVSALFVMLHGSLIHLGFRVRRRHSMISLAFNHGIKPMTMCIFAHLVVFISVLIFPALCVKVPGFRGILSCHLP